MGHFYNPPPPSQGNSASTPPLPHDPIPAQGDSPPPIRQAALAVTMLAILASWPADLEPRLQRPNDQQQKIAPLTLRYGQEQRTPPIAVPELAAIVGAWPVDVGPTLPWPYWTRNVSAPAIPAPPVSFVPYARPPYAVFALASETYDPSLVWRPGRQPPDNPSQPPRQFALNPTTQAQLGLAWTDPPPLPVRPVQIAALTLPTGSSPLPEGPLSVSELAQLVASWPQSWDAQSGPKLVQPPILAAIPFTPPARAIWDAWTPADPSAPPRVLIAPLTLPTGAPPPPRGPLSVTALTQTIAAWATTWDAQTAPESAAWNVPPIFAAVPYSTLPRAIWTAWEPPFIAPPAPVTIAPLTLAYGSQPPPRALQSNARLVDIAASWIQSWDAQTAPESAGWNVPPILVSLPYTPPPRLIWTAWEPPWVQPPAPVAVAVLTLPTGNQPPPRGLDRQVATAALWVGDPALPSRPLAAGWNVPAIGYVPPSVFPLAIRAAWDQVATALPRLVTIATAAIPPPQAPPPRSGWTRAHAIAHAAWPSALEPAKSLQSIVIWLTPSGPATSSLRFVTVTNETIQTAAGGAETIATAAGGLETIATVHTAQEAIDA